MANFVNHWFWLTNDYILKLANLDYVGEMSECKTTLNSSLLVAKSIINIAFSMFTKRTRRMNVADIIE